MRKLRISCCIKVLLIFGGIILIQMVSSMAFMAAYTFLKIFQGASYNDIIQSINTDSLMWISIISATLSMIWCLVLYLRSSWRIKGMDYKEVFSLKNIAGIFAVGAGGCISISVLLSMIMALFPNAFDNYNRLMENLDSDGGALTIIYVTLIGPVSEELIFRWAIFDRMHLAFPFWTANAIQAMFFGIYHMNLVQGIYAFLLGVVLGMVVYATGSILCSIAVHMVFNSTTYIIQSVFGGDSPVMAFLFLICILISIIMLAFGLRYYIIRCKEKYRFEKGNSAY